ncbi:hypothetical protein [Actinoplanes awajinensis]|uniref:Uncharacterized protein n=1 Tax=Actinoplanes awajinensis subsp. mycoplanecinus TaxID=135947 RepID=A0A0X3VC33_9ACTN|nr:hypothetical protein [Actinoplanes awajinensis]KUL41822.1 hypothetical protein ADL15_02940 [Actinoplanes awajinensis subsp. mycoplanecinus]
MTDASGKTISDAVKASNTAKVTSLAGFAKSRKPPTKAVGAFDGPDRTVDENVVFGSGTVWGLGHTMAEATADFITWVTETFAK